MKKVYVGIGILCLALAIIIGGSVLFEKIGGDDYSFLDEIIDFDKYTPETPKDGKRGSTGYTEMSITEKEKKADKNAVVSEHEVVFSDIGELKVDAKLSDAEWQGRIDEGITKENINNANRECANLYYYSNLDNSQKQLYLEIYLSIINFTESFYICTLSPEDIDFCFNTVMADHPEIYYVNGYLFTKYTAGDEIVKIEFSPAYTMEKSEAKQCKQYIDAYEKTFLAGIDKTRASDYEKIKYTYEYIIKNTEYDLKAEENQNILSVFMNGKSVCQGYSKAFQYLLSKLDVQSTLVVGFVGGGEGHAWNLVKCDKEYYYVDCTWGDSSYLQNANDTSGSDGINYDYLNITTTELERTHIIDNFAELPLCSSNTSNYYIKEGLYFNKIDENQLQQAFDKAMRSGKKTVEIKCSDLLVYDKMGTYLLDENHVFDYVGTNKESLTYIKNQDLFIYSFPLD